MLNQQRWEEVQYKPINQGKHEALADGACVMELVSYVAGEKWSDAPKCACPVLTAFMVNWNDNLPNDDERTRLLAPLVPKLVGTRSTKAVERRRSFMAFDWLVRVHAPTWLDLMPALAEHAAALRALPELVDKASVEAAYPVLDRARTASDAAGDAAGDAAWAAAAGDAAWAAAAGDAAWAAARAAAGDAAWAAAAGDAAWAAARAAAGAALKTTKENLQQSAVELVERMIAVKP